MFLLKLKINGKMIFDGTVSRIEIENDGWAIAYFYETENGSYHVSHKIKNSDIVNLEWTFAY